ncbi:MAG: YdbH domain-containing protein [Planctomycetes bacterium]|nr:YdbH domain-containing protein [Planctomycetota bacterium]
MTTTEPTQSSRKRRPRRFARGLVIASLGLTLLGLLLWVFVVPQLVESELEAALRAEGFGEVTMDLRGVTWGGLVISDLSLSSDRTLEVDSVSVTWDLGSLWARRIKKIELTGLRGLITFGSEGVDLGEIGRFLERRRAGSSADGAPASRPPFDEIAIKGATIVLRHSEWSHRITVDGALRAGEEWQVSLDLSALERTWRLAGSYGLDGEALTATLRLASDQPPWSGPRLSGRLSEEAIFRLDRGKRGSQSSGDETGRPLVMALALETNAIDDVVAGHRLRLAQSHVELTAELDTDFGLQRFHAQVSAKDASLDDFAVDEFVIVASGDGAAADLSLTARAASWAARDGAWSITGPQLFLQGRLRADDEGAAFDVSPETALRAEAIGFMAGEEAVTSGPHNLGLEAVDASRPMVEIRWPRLGSAPTQARVAGRLKNREVFAVNASGMDSVLEQLVVEGEATWSADRPLIATAVMNVEAGATTLAGAQLIERTRLTLKVDHDVDAGLWMTGGELTVGPLTWREQQVPAIRLTLEPRDDGGLRIDGRWTLIAADPFVFSGEIGLDGRGEFSLLGKPTPVSPGDPLANLLETFGVRLTGKAGIEARLALKGGGPALELIFILEDAGLAGTRGPWSFDHVAARIRVTSLAPLRSAGGQSITWTSGAIGDLVLEQGGVQFAVESPQSILVERATWRMGDRGRFFVHGFRFDPGAPDVTCQLFVEDLGLAKWLEVATLDHARGEGSLNGRILLRIRTSPRLKVALGEGYLYAAGPGAFQIDDAALVDDVLQSSGAAGSPGDYGKLSRQRIVGALQDFAYRSLTFDIVPRAGGLSLQVATEGKGRAVPQEMTLNVNFNGFDDFIALAIGLKLGIEKTRDDVLKRLRAH